MELAGFLIQMIGAITTGVGLFIAWDRASGRFERWRKRMRESIAGLPARLAERRGDNVITPEPGRIEVVMGKPGVSMTGTVKAPGTAEERLTSVEAAIAEMNVRIDARIKAAIDDELTEVDEADKLFAARDISCAILGLVISAIGFVIEHGPLLQRLWCR